MELYNNSIVHVMNLKYKMSGLYITIGFEKVVWSSYISYVCCFNCAGSICLHMIVYTMDYLFNMHALYIIMLIIGQKIH